MSEQRERERTSPYIRGTSKYNEEYTGRKYT
jgi:hypothetical protein